MRKSLYCSFGTIVISHTVLKNARLIVSIFFVAHIWPKPPLTPPISFSDEIKILSTYQHDIQDEFKNNF